MTYYLGVLTHLKIKYAMNSATEEISAAAAFVRIPVNVLMRRYSGHISA